MPVPPIPAHHLSAGSEPVRRFRLLEQVRMRLQERRYSRATEKAYVYWIRRFVIHHGRRHPREMGGAEVAAFLSHLARESGVSASTQNQALAALKFLYDAVVREPLAPSADIAPAGGGGTSFRHDGWYEILPACSDDIMSTHRWYSARSRPVSRQQGSRSG